MYVLRLTRRLLARVGAPEEPASPSTTTLGDWYANLVSVGWARYILLVNEQSRLPVVMPGRDVKNLARNFPGALAPVLSGLGIPAAAVEQEIAAMSEATVAATTSRSVLGTMNDFSLILSHYLWDDPAPDLVALSLRLGRTPVRPLDDVFPDRATRRLFGLSGRADPGGITSRSVPPDAGG